MKEEKQRVHISSRTTRSLISLAVVKHPLLKLISSNFDCQFPGIVGVLGGRDVHHPKFVHQQIYILRDVFRDDSLSQEIIDRCLDSASSSAFPRR